MKDYGSCHPCMPMLLIAIMRKLHVDEKVSHVRVKSSADYEFYAPVDALPLWRSRRIKIQKKEVVAYCSKSSTGPSLQKKQCPICSFECPSIAILLSHLLLVHSSDPRFLVCCGINSCTVTSRSFSSLYTHVYRYQPGAGNKTAVC